MTWLCRGAEVHTDNGCRVQARNNRLYRCREDRLRSLLYRSAPAGKLLPLFWTPGFLTGNMLCLIFFGTGRLIIHFSNPSYQKEPDRLMMLWNVSHTIHCHKVNSPDSDTPARVRSALFEMPSRRSVSLTTSLRSERNFEAFPLKSGDPGGSPLAGHGVRSLFQSMPVITTTDTPNFRAAAAAHSSRLLKG